MTHQTECDSEFGEDLNSDENTKSRLISGNRPDIHPTENTRNKVTIKPGKTLGAWMSLVGTGKDLSGTNGSMLKVSRQEVQKHTSDDDLWVILHGRVYNLTHYIDYHPGGPGKLRAVAGKDATKLFIKYHPWVNYSALLCTCLVGVLEQDT